MKTLSNILKFIFECFIIIFILSIPVFLVVWLIQEVNADDWPTIIGCINQDTLETKIPKQWNCFYWNWWQNIMLPNQEHMKIWEEVFDSKQAIINRLPIVNFESWFNENASNKWAIWYVQTLRTHNIDKDIKSQLEWMKNRQDYQKQEEVNWKYGKIKACGYYKENYNEIDWFPAWEEWVIACLYRWHYHAQNGSWYARKAMKAREYYINYFNNIE